jgi:hypothetical protein
MTGFNHSYLLGVPRSSVATSVVTWYMPPVFAYTYVYTYARQWCMMVTHLYNTPLPHSVVGTPGSDRAARWLSIRMGASEIITISLDKSQGFAFSAEQHSLVDGGT